MKTLFFGYTDTISRRILTSLQKGTEHWQEDQQSLPASEAEAEARRRRGGRGWLPAASYFELSVAHWGGRGDSSLVRPRLTSARGPRNPPTTTRQEMSKNGNWQSQEASPNAMGEGKRQLPCQSQKVTLRKAAPSVKGARHAHRSSQGFGDDARQSGR